MTTSTTATRRLSQAFPIAERSDVRLVGLKDGEILARYLNESKGTKSHARILEIHKQAEKIWTESAILQNTLQDARKQIAIGQQPASDPLHVAKHLIKARKSADLFKQQRAQLSRKYLQVNKALQRYVFHPHIGYTIITGTPGAGLWPEKKADEFQLQVGEWTLTEADAAMALVRLYLAGELKRVQLCAKCRCRWLVAAKSHYRFCSAECREQFYRDAPHYLEKKAEIQARYRENRKRAERAGVGWERNRGDLPTPDKSATTQRKRQLRTQR